MCVLVAAILNIFINNLDNETNPVLIKCEDNTSLGSFRLVAKIRKQNKTKKNKNLII